MLVVPGQTSATTPPFLFWIASSLRPGPSDFVAAGGMPMSGAVGFSMLVDIAAAAAAAFAKRLDLTEMTRNQ